MAVIRIRYQGRIHSRTVTRNYRGWYIMVSRGREYWFNRTEDGWQLINGTSLPIEFIIQIGEELNKLEGR